MKILYINLGFDCAGSCWNMRNAIDRLPGWEAFEVSGRATPMAKRADFFTRRVDDIAKLAGEYDILHFNNWIWTFKPSDQNEHDYEFLPKNEYGTGHPFEKYEGRKQFVFHFHRGSLQWNPGYWLEECKRVGAKMIKCDPLAPLPGARWLPNVVDFSEVQPHLITGGSPVSVVGYGGPMDKRRNNGEIDILLEYLKVNHTFFGDIPRSECFRLRRNYNVSVDNLTQGFIGMWGWESLAMGQVLLSHMEPETLEAYGSFFGEEPPIYHTANVDFIAERVCHYRKYPEDLVADGSRSAEWARRWCIPSRIAEHYIELYEA